jgi:hypothetical protein
MRCNEVTFPDFLSIDFESFPPGVSAELVMRLHTLKCALECWKKFGECVRQQAEKSKRIHLEKMRVNQEVKRQALAIMAIIHQYPEIFGPKWTFLPIGAHSFRLNETLPRVRLSL